MPTKKEVEQVLENRDWDTLKLWASEHRNVYRQLMTRIYVKDGLIFWRAVEGLGFLVREIEKIKPAFAVELVRRYFWMLNDESGGTAWNASEAIGSLLAYNPKTCGHFNWMLSGLLVDESLKDGALWGLVQLAQTAPHLVDPLEERISPLLEDEKPFVRGLAALIYSLVRKPQEDFALYREQGPKWRVSDELDQRLKNDQARLEIYQDGRFASYSVQELWQVPTLAYWSEQVTISDLEVEITAAFSAKGLCWLGIEPIAKEEESLRAWASRRFPKGFLIRKREPNAVVFRQLSEYFSGQRQEFTIPLHQIGTPFQLQVWEELLRIPYGETRSYGDIAAKVGNPKGSRAVGMANNQNPLGIVVPCHRVIGKNGSLTGYAGGLNVKAKLLELEGATDPGHKEESADA
ncbi:6-O-methylguanine DNA methyltransferase [Desulfosporosinus sp. HMP52]|uniref:DVU0298 family protein n=1 Tax=Desulfosporosinus sp. HMP52 TaxID=1487923 RepID=UPI00051FF281|nr:DVU0298 family protein [Desulfosporosinus sp. HMP52]KGK91884.1 6-O-methylguanine DNA methyltransferase [Desulfosporosinus sp. HMP52]